MRAGTLATTAAVALGRAFNGIVQQFCRGHCPVKAVTDGPKFNWKPLWASAAPSPKAWSTSPNTSPARAETSR